MGIMNWNVEHIENFTLREARCHGWEYINPVTPAPHDCGLIILVPELCKCVYEVRIRFGKPIIVKSWTRCMPHNLAVGGKPGSYHVVGRAIDMAPKNMSDLDELYEIAEDVFPFTYRASWGLHGDIRGKRPVRYVPVGNA